MAPVKEVSGSEFTLADYEDGLQIFEDTKRMMQRLEDWAKERPTAISRDTIDSMHDLVGFCKAAVQQYYAAFNEYKLRPQEILAEDSRSSPGGSVFQGFDSPRFPNDHFSVLNGLARECEIRTAEVADKLDRELSRISKEPDERDTLKYSNMYDSGFINNYNSLFEKFGTKSKISPSLYLKEKLKKFQSELETELLPNLNDLVTSLIEYTREDCGHTLENKISKEMEAGLQFSLCMEVATSSLSSISDPLNIKIYAENEIPYEGSPEVSSGRGAYGVVYQVCDTRTGAVLAVKQLSQIYSAKKVAAVRQELSMLEICNHQNIIALLDAYQVEGDPSKFYIVIDPWAPYTLESFIHQTDVERCKACAWFIQDSLSTENQVIQIFAGLASGVGYLHSNSIKHKDIKPLNILLYDAGNGIIRPIISDLGISKIFKVGDHTNPRVGTNRYLAPEQYEEIDSTLISDIWQLGCCFALTLAVLRKGSTGRLQLWRSFDNSDAQCSSNIAMEWKHFMPALKIICGGGTSTQRHAHRIITKMLEVEPQDRWDIETVKSELALLLSSKASS